MFSNNILTNISKIRNFSSTKRNFTIGRILFNKKPYGAKSSSSNLNVQGLSERVFKIPQGEEVGPGASKSSNNYQNPEYFCYDKNSYFEAEVEMLKFRCPQPSADKYYEQKFPK